MRRRLRATLEVMFGLAAAAAIALSAPCARAQGQLTVGPVWQLQLPAELRGRLHETAIAPGEPRIVATTPSAILALDQGGALRSLIELDRGHGTGETVVLAENGGRAGLMTHQHDAITRFRLIALGGPTLAAVEAPPAFHYRLAPDGASFVAIDAGGGHVQADADSFTYRFYDASGALTAEIRSQDPQPVDSGYSADGAAFIVNDANGLTAYRLTDGRRLWQVPMPTRLFAAASAASGLVVASGASERNLARGFRNGEALWRLGLDGNVRNLAISPTGAFMLATDGDTAHLLSPDSDRPIWSFSVPDHALTINSATVTDRGVVGLGAQHSSLHEGLALVLDRGGATRFAHRFSYELSNAWIPRVQTDASGALMLIRTREELLLVALR